LHPDNSVQSQRDFDERIKKLRQANFKMEYKTRLGYKAAQAAAKTTPTGDELANAIAVASVAASLLPQHLQAQALSQPSLQQPDNQQVRSLTLRLFARVSCNECLPIS
jgi:hypothetical protein